MKNVTANVIRFTIFTLVLVFLTSSAQAATSFAAGISTTIDNTQVGVEISNQLQTSSGSSGSSGTTVVKDDPYRHRHELEQQRFVRLHREYFDHHHQEWNRLYEEQKNRDQQYRLAHNIPGKGNWSRNNSTNSWDKNTNSTTASSSTSSTTGKGWSQNNTTGTTTGSTTGTQSWSLNGSKTGSSTTGTGTTANSPTTTSKSAGTSGTSTSQKYASRSTHLARRMK